MEQSYMTVRKEAAIVIWQKDLLRRKMENGSYGSCYR